ncbi:hypothetical protein HGA88_04325 [Candidatus Roizmanbacteria bacterium]|nr:hypothetical protein [Candidatus Roizmanbacteria bacterium]
MKEHINPVNISLRDLGMSMLKQESIDPKNLGLLLEGFWDKYNQELLKLSKESCRQPDGSFFWDTTKTYDPTECQAPGITTGGEPFATYAIKMSGNIAESEENQLARVNFTIRVEHYGDLYLESPGDTLHEMVESSYNTRAQNVDVYSRHYNVVSYSPNEQIPRTCKLDIASDNNATYQIDARPKAVISGLLLIDKIFSDIGLKGIDTNLDSKRIHN